MRSVVRSLLLFGALPAMLVLSLKPPVSTTSVSPSQRPRELPSYA